MPIGDLLALNPQLSPPQHVNLVSERDALLRGQRCRRLQVTGLGVRDRLECYGLEKGLGLVL